MTQLSSILDIDELGKMIDANMIRRVESQDGRFALYNYTDLATYSRTWTRETRLCRGLIEEIGSGEIVCRPFSKFFNYGEAFAPALPSEWHNVEATAKLDGSMVAVWYDEFVDDWRCTTRGSFVSDQASAALVWLRNHARLDLLSPHFTYVCEWTAPDNRVVLKYDKPQLSLLAEIRTYDGAEMCLSPDQLKQEADSIGLGCPRAWTFSDIDAISRAQQVESGVEGWALRWPNGEHFERVKVKTDEYIRLHKIISGFSAERVREMMLSGPFGAREYIAQLPDEIQTEAEEIYHEIARRVGLKVDEILHEYGKRSALLEDGRKAFALAVCRDFDGDDRASLFALADGRDIRGDVLKRVDIRDIQTSVKL